MKIEGLHTLRHILEVALKNTTDKEDQAIIEKALSPFYNDERRDYEPCPVMSKLNQ